GRGLTLGWRVALARRARSGRRHDNVVRTGAVRNARGLRGVRARSDPRASDQALSWVTSPAPVVASAKEHNIAVGLFDRVMSRCRSRFPESRRALLYHATWG